MGNRVAKVLVGARRANNYNSQLVGELKRWNRRLEVFTDPSFAVSSSAVFVVAPR